jgi:hypothetical protein
MYDRRVKTLVILGDAPLPDALRDVIERGSTSIVERRAAELAGRRPPGDIDRVVLWASAGDHEVARLARDYSRGASPEEKDSLIVIAPESSTPLAGVSHSEVFVWPRDEDRLKVAFMTGG